MPTNGPNPSVVAARPAESLTIVGAIAFLIARALGVDNDTTMTALTMVIAFTPAAVTWLVELISRGKVKEGSAMPTDAVAVELKDLNKTLREALAANVKEASGTPSDAVAVELKDLNKTLREALASRSLPQSNGSLTVASDFVDAVEKVLATRTTEKDGRAREVREVVTDLVDELGEGIHQRIARMFADQREEPTITGGP